MGFFKTIFIFLIITIINEPNCCNISKTMMFCILEYNARLMFMSARFLLPLLKKGKKEKEEWRNGCSWVVKLGRIIYLPCQTSPRRAILTASTSAAPSILGPNQARPGPKWLYRPLFCLAHISKHHSSYISLYPHRGARKSY